jgi:plasmid maintenance system antidote protein VapI
MVGDISISSEMAVRLGKLCGNGPGIWIRLQARYDTWEAARRLGSQLEKIRLLSNDARRGGNRAGFDSVV